MGWISEDDLVSGEDGEEDAEAEGAAEEAAGA
jgi:hypothetical protein